MRIKAIVCTIILVVLLAAGFGWWTTHSQAVLARVEDTLAGELTKVLGSPVTVGRLEVVGLTSAVVQDVTVYDKQGQEVAIIDKVTVAYSPFSLLRGQTVSNALRSVSLTAPKVFLLQKADGSWNIEYLKPEQQEGPSFTGKVFVETGVVSVSTPQGHWEFAGVDGQLDFARDPQIDFKLAATNNNSGLNAQGAINYKQNRLSLTVRADTIDPAAYQALLPAGSDIKFSSGSLAAVDFTINKTAAELRYAGEFLLQDLAATIDGVAVSQACGRVTFTPDNVYILGGSAQISGQPLTINGKIAIAGNQPVFNLAVASPGFDPAAVIRDTPFTGVVAFTADVWGTRASPVVAAELKAAQATVGTYQLSNAQAKVNYANNILTVTTLSSQLLGGQVTGQGTVDTVNKNYQFALAGKNLDVAAVQDLPVDISGKGDLDLTISGQGYSIAGATATVAVTLGPGQVSGVEYSKIVGIIQQTQGITILEHLNAVLPSGLITVSGTAAADKLDLKVNGQDLELKDIPLAALKDIALAGTAGFAGEITGRAADPKLSMSFNVNKLQIKDQLFGQADGSLQASSKAVIFDRVDLTDGAARHELTGSITFSGQPEVNLKLTTRSARAETFARIFIPNVKLTGNIEHEVILTGPLSNVAASGRVKLTDGSLGDYLIAKAEGTYQRNDGITKCNDFTIQSLNTKIAFAGTVAPGNNLNFTVTAQDIDIGRLRVKYPYPVTGLVNLTGQLTGTPAKPMIAGQLVSSNIMLNGQELKQISAELTYQDGYADIRELRFTQGGGSYVFNGAVDLNSDGLDGMLRVENGELAGILSMAVMPDRGIHGRLDGEIALSGTLSNPNVLLRGAITGGKIKDYPLDTVDIDAELKNKVITVNKFVAKQGIDGMIAAQGTADLAGKIDLEVGGRGIQTGILAALFDTTVETKGQFSFNAQASGSTLNPNVAVSLDVKSGAVANAEFDNLYGLFIFNNGSIHVNQLFVARGPYKASAYGVVPLKALNSQGRSKADTGDMMDLKLRLDNADLSILPMLTKGVSWASGPTTGEIAIGGTLAQPTLDGRLTVTKGVVKLAALADPIKNVGVDIQFADDKININAFDGEMGGGSYSLTGSASVQGLSLTNYDLQVALNHLGIHHKYFEGPIDGALSLTSKDGRPLLYGKLTVDNATVNIPALPDSNPIDLDAGLDVELVVGNKVHMYNPYLYDFRAGGKIKFTGSMQKPVASGHIEAGRGSVKYLTTRFTINSGSADFTQYDSIEPVIRLNAETKLERTTIKLNIVGPASAMDLKLTSEPAMSQQEIMSLLTLQSSYFSKQNQSAGNNSSTLGRDELVSLLDAGLQMRFIAEMENSMRNTLGVDEFRLVRDSDSLFSTRSKESSSTDQNIQGYNLEIGKYLTDKIFVSYTIGLDQKTNSVAFRYDLTKRIGIGGTFGGTNNGLYTVETKFNF